MTKKNTKNSNTKSNNTKINPFVSICTPTFNRRPFIPYMIKCFEHQNYPKDKIEWIIIDDGTDPIQDLVTNIPQVKYYYFNEKIIDCFFSGTIPIYWGTKNISKYFDENGIIFFPNIDEWGFNMDAALE